MSRGQKILELALSATIDQPFTFVVNIDGSLSKVEENHTAEANQTISPVKPVEGLDNNLSLSELNLSNIIDDIDKNDDLSTYLDLGKNILALEGDDTVCEKGQNICPRPINSSDNDVPHQEQQHGSDKNSDVVVPPQDKLPRSDDVNPQEEELPESDENEELIENDSQNEVEPNRKRRKRHQVKISTWKINKWKEARKTGKEYCGKKKNNDGHYDYNIKKNARKMKIRCKCQRKENSMLQCATLTENERKTNFDEFWRLHWQAKKVMVKLLTQKTETARIRGRKDETKSRRKYSCKYYLKKSGTNVRVCKTMFLNTLSISEWMALHWQGEDRPNEYDSEENVDDVDEPNTVEEPKRKQLRKSAEVEALQEFFNTLPKVESHYCRKRTKKLYLEPNWKSKRELYQFYKIDWCGIKNVGSLSQCKFDQMFGDLNLALFKPKKDICDKCESFKMGNLCEEAYESHILRKEEARLEKEADINRNDCLTYTMDLQALLLSPRSNVSALYYKMKLSTHNFTIYNLGTHDGYCYLWNETEGGLTSNEFGTIIYKFLESQLPLPEGKTKLILYSDGCAYQNRSATVANALLHFSCTNKVTVEQKYLEVGHTQMEGDAMHSLIERRLKNVKINVPADYINVCKQARKSPAEYHVEYLEHTYFKNFEDHLFFKSIRPGKTVGDPCVTDIRAFQYNPNGTINFKFNFSDEWELLPQRKNAKIEVTAIEHLPNLYNERLSIKRRKYDHLQDLKSVLAMDYHEFYDNIPFN